MDDDEDILKWLLLESEIQHLQEKAETKETDRKIEELEYEIQYYKQYLHDIELIQCDIWNTGKKEMQTRLLRLNAQLKYFKEQRAKILVWLRNSENYGLSDKLNF